MRIHRPDPADGDDVEFAAASAPPEALAVESILAAWHEATERLQQTHEVLHEEVVRLRAELEDKNRELARQMRLADLGRMASHVAHEVRNSLVPVSLYLSLLRRRLVDDAGSLEVLAKVEAGFRALDATVNDLLSFTSHREPQWRSFLIQDLLEEVVDSLAPQLEAQGIDATLDVPPYTVVTADRELLRRAVLNLVLNALDAMPRGGEIVVTSYDGAGGFELEIADNGPGLTPEQRVRACEPFYTTKPHGTGLGLAIVHRIMEAHGGELTVQNCPDGGAAFTLKFPPRRALGAAA